METFNYQADQVTRILVYCYEMINDVKNLLDLQMLTKFLNFVTLKYVLDYADTLKQKKSTSLKDNIQYLTIESCE